MQRVKDILKRVDWKELAWVYGPRLAFPIALIFVIAPVAKLCIAIGSRNTPGFSMSGTEWMWLGAQAVFWLVVIVMTGGYLVGQFLDFKDRAVERFTKVGLTVYRFVVGKEFPRV